MRILGKIAVKVFVACFAVAIFAATSGCVTQTYGEVPNEFKAKIAKGKTTKTEVLQELGNPDQKIDLGKGQEQFSYIKEEYSSALGGLKTKNTEFWVVFDVGGKVSDFGERPTNKAKNYSGGLK